MTVDRLDPTRPVQGVSLRWFPNGTSPIVSVIVSGQMLMCYIWVGQNMPTP